MKRRETAPLSIESLEGREMMAADVVFASGVLNITGTNQADQVVVNQTANTYQVTIKDIASGNTLVQKSFTTTGLKSINFECLGGNDVAINNTNKPSVVRGGAGSDLLIGGTAHDLIFGDAGCDLIFGRSGNDTIFGGADDDIIFGDEGDDEIWGGDGLDYMLGGAGFDRTDGEVENDGPVSTLQVNFSVNFDNNVLSTSIPTNNSQPNTATSSSGQTLGLSGTDLGSGRIIDVSGMDLGSGRIINVSGMDLGSGRITSFQGTDLGSSRIYSVSGLDLGSSRLR